MRKDRLLSSGLWQWTIVVVVLAAVVALGFGPVSNASAQVKQLSVIVKLNPDRTQGGEVTLIDSSGHVIAGPFPALGKAANNTAKAKGNEGANPLKPYGDTPAGTYSMKHIRSTSELNQRSYGPHGAIVLEPEGGDALLAKANGRTGLWIHGGAPGRKGGLRRTNGCVRLSNDDMKSLIDAIVAGSPSASANSCQITEVSVTVYPDDGGDDVDNGDPPNPGSGQIIFP